MPAKIADAFRSPFGSGFTRTQRHNEGSRDLYQKDGADLEYHIGEDWAPLSGKATEPVLAAANGTVVQAGSYGSFGNLVIIRHELADHTFVTTLYGHLHSISVSAGSTVEIGQKIGVAGNTGGLSFGVHLHFGVYLGVLSTADIRGFAEDPDPDVYTSGYVDPTYFIQNFKPPVADTTPPKLESSTPADNATKVPLDADFTFTFSEKVVKGSGTIELWSKSGLLESVDVGSSRVSISSSGKTVTVDPKADLASGKDYWILIKAGAFKDEAGNPYGGIDSKTALNFTAVTDKTAPRLTDTSPDDGASKVSTSANIRLEFDERVVAGSGKIEIYRSDGKLFESIDVESSRVTFSADGQTVTIDPKGKFAAGTSYYVVLKSGVLEDAAGNDFAGIKKGALDFKTSSSSSSATAMMAVGPEASANDAPGTTAPPAVFTLGTATALTQSSASEASLTGAARQLLDSLPSLDELFGTEADNSINGLGNFAHVSLQAFGEQQSTAESPIPFEPIMEGWILP